MPALTQNALFADELVKLIDEECENARDKLENGLSVVDYASYQRQVGVLHGLRLVRNSLIPEINKKLSER